MNEDKVLLTIAVVAVVVSVIAAGFTYFSVANLVSKISGFATSTGEANLTVESAAVINFTTNFISWGSGRVNTGENSATLTTLETNNVTNGNWTLQQTGGFRIQNVGNVNVSLDLAAGKTAAQFLAGDSPEYQWNVTNVEADSCANATTLGVWSDTNTTSPGTRFCNFFQYLNDRDEVRIDIRLVVPYNSQTGELTDTITATATEA